jgi:diguanylate cyclase (GGDEF)-like protein
VSDPSERDVIEKERRPPSPPSLRLLIADDDPISGGILLRTVHNWGFETVRASDGAEAWQRLLDPEIRLAILDWEMPEANGPDLCRRIRENPKKLYTYIILLTSRDNPEDIIAGLGAGADDYMTKPVKLLELRARLQTGRRVIDLEDKLLDHQKRLYELATKDGLTKLWNRRTILQFLSDELAHAERTNLPASAIMIDVDHFKTINDTWGHQAGDKVLITLARRLKRQVRPYDRIGRYGGDEILMVLPHCDVKDTAIIAERIRKACAREPVRWEGRPLDFTVSIGVASTEGRRRPTVDRLIQAGDQALYEAKRMGRDRVVEAEWEPARRKGFARSVRKK